MVGDHDGIAPATGRAASSACVEQTETRAARAAATTDTLRVDRRRTPADGGNRSAGDIHGDRAAIAAALAVGTKPGNTKECVGAGRAAGAADALCKDAVGIARSVNDEGTAAGDGDVAAETGRPSASTAETGDAARASTAASTAIGVHDNAGHVGNAGSVVRIGRDVRGVVDRDRSAIPPVPSVSGVSRAGVVAAIASASTAALSENAGRVWPLHRNRSCRRDADRSTRVAVAAIAGIGNGTVSTIAAAAAIRC